MKKVLFLKSTKIICMLSIYQAQTLSGYNTHVLGTRNSLAACFIFDPRQYASITLSTAVSPPLVACNESGATINHKNILTATFAAHLKLL